MPTLLRPLLLLACLLCAGTAHAREQTFMVGAMQVTAWTPDQPVPGRLPVLVFSHGLHGCDVQSRWLTAGLANAGYLVFAPNHRDASCNGGTTPWFEGTELMFLHPDQWTEDSYRNRADDIRRLVAALYDDGRFRERADWSRLGLVGHSLGGYTVLGLAGAWPGWKLPGVRAVLALAPYSLPFDVRKSWGGVDVPLMFQCAQQDFAITPFVSQPGGSYELAREPKYYVEFANADHFAWTNRDTAHQSAILSYSLAFLDRYVKGERDNARYLTGTRPEVIRLRYDSELGHSDSAAGQPDAAPPQ
jgi:predicted dienelactone hydrolase